MIINLMVQAVAFVHELNFQVSHGTDRLEAAKRAHAMSLEARDAWNYAEEEYRNELLEKD